MIPTKAYILRIDTDISKEYAKACADSCDRVGLPWEYFEGYTEKTVNSNTFVIKTTKRFQFRGKGGAATAGHLHIWKKIADNKECAIVLEHDALMLHKPTLDIPDGQLVALGYKVTDPENYKHDKAGPPIKIEKRDKHGGAHAYALTHVTASQLINTLEKTGLTSMIDNAFFLRNGSRGSVNLGITDPICALGWLRQSTIWPKSAVDNYKPVLESFRNNYQSKRDLGLKN